MVRGTYLIFFLTKIREAGSYYLSPGHLGLTVREVTVWLPGLSLETAIWLAPSLTYSKLASWAIYCR